MPARAAPGSLSLMPEKGGHTVRPGVRKVLDDVTVVRDAVDDVRVHELLQAVARPLGALGAARDPVRGGA